MGTTSAKPRLLITLGDVAGIGPEVLVKAWAAGKLHRVGNPLVIGDPDALRRTAAKLAPELGVSDADGGYEWTSSPERITCFRGSDIDLSKVPLGSVSADAGRAAYDFLCTAIDWTLAGRADAIITLPLHKGGLHAAGLPYPGHTEILADRTRTPRHAMMLYAPPSATQNSTLKTQNSKFKTQNSGLGVIHVTLHCALRDVFARLSVESVLEKIELLATIMRKLAGRPPRIGVCGLNPHAGDGGLFGDEEARIIAPAVAQARSRGIDASGPWPSDTLFARAFGSEFDGVAAMYHDQGHIPFKLMAGLHAVNVTVGLPIIRTSVAHGTAYDIAGQGRADPNSLIEAGRLAARLVILNVDF